MGDALEYFHDLGLEYNVDYVDATKKATGRRVKVNYEELEPVKDDDVSTTSDTKKKTDTKDEVKKDNDDDNLFDLIDSMYKEEE